MSFPKITTGVGDEGTTHLWSGEVISKTDPRIQAIGSIDLALSALGRGHGHLDAERDASLIETLFQIHRRFIHYMGELASSEEKVEAYRSQKQPIGQEDIDWIDEEIEAAREKLSERNDDFALWKLYGEGGPAAAEFYFIRGLFRQAEIKVLELAVSGVAVRRELKVFINRISDLMFLLALLLEE